MTELAAAYAAGATTRELAAEHGVNESTIRYRLRTAGVTLRTRGQREQVDVEQIIALRRAHKLAWSAVAQAAGCSETAVRKAYRRATGEQPRPPRSRPLTTRQTEQLRALYERCPPISDTQRSVAGVEGRKLAERISVLRASGVTVADIAAAVGRTAGWPAGVLATHDI